MLGAFENAELKNPALKTSRIPVRRFLNFFFARMTFPDEPEDLRAEPPGEETSRRPLPEENPPNRDPTFTMRG